MDTDSPITVITGKAGRGRAVAPARGDSIPTIWFEPAGPFDLRQTLSLAGSTVDVELAAVPGCLDPLRIIEDPQKAVALAVEMLLAADDWGDVIPAWSSKDQLCAAVQYGLSTGAFTTYAALTAAEAAGTLHVGTVDALFEVIGKNPMATAVFGCPSRT